MTGQLKGIRKLKLVYYNVTPEKGERKRSTGFEQKVFCLCLTLQDFSGIWCSHSYERVAIPHVSSLV